MIQTVRLCYLKISHIVLIMSGKSCSRRLDPSDCPTTSANLDNFLDNIHGPMFGKSFRVISQSCLATYSTENKITRPVARQTKRRPATIKTWNGGSVIER